MVAVVVVVFWSGPSLLLVEFPSLEQGKEGKRLGKKRISQKQEREPGLGKAARWRPRRPSAEPHWSQDCLMAVSPAHQHFWKQADMGFA